MAQSKDHLSDLDRHVHLLESKVNQLRASLTHWQQWYLEYSALKEEVEQLPTDPPPHEQLRRIRRDFDGKLLSKKEINEILGKNDLKQPEQIVSVLSRRMDYVEKNIDSLTKLIENEENKLAAASVVAKPDAGTDEETGLPLTDIIEELDEDDNVINFRLQSGADVEPKIVEALRKAGIQEKDIPETEAELPKREEVHPSSPKQDDAAKQSVADPAATTSDTKGSPQSDGTVSRKKSVSFAEDTKPGDAAAEPPKSRAAEKLERLMQQAREQEAMDMSSAVIPDNESPEDSELRREMLKYGMSEIGPVVAELQLEEGYSDDDDDMDWIGTDDEFEEEETDDDGEDELGRSKRSVISSDYIKRMQELEKRLNVQSAFTVGGSETKPKPKPQDEGIGRIAVVGDSGSSAASPTLAPRGKKSVSFASKLDIAPNPEPQPPAEVRPKERKIADVGDIVEKTAEPEMVKEPEEPPKRVSRFKKERATVAPSSTSPAVALPLGPHQLPATLFPAKATPPVEPAPPEHGTIAPTVVERPTPPDPAEPDEMDDALLYQAAAVEYSRLRNQLIQKQGGFLQQDGAIDSETGLVPLDEELGGPKRMSKFKAARLTKLQ
jgi:unconventional prefoldin RPB5 interactor 1